MEFSHPVAEESSTFKPHRKQRPRIRRKIPGDSGPMKFLKRLAHGTVDSRGHSTPGWTSGRTGNAAAPHLHAGDISADVTCSFRVITIGTRVLAVLQNLEVDVQLLQRIGISGDWAVTVARNLRFLAVVDNGDSNRVISIFCLGAVNIEGSTFQRIRALQIVLVEDIPEYR